MRYFDLKFGYSVKGKSVTCFLLPHFNGDKVRLNKEFANCLDTERFGLMLVVLTDLNRLCDIHPMSYTVTCKDEDEFKEKVGKALARRHLIIKVLAHYNDLLDDLIHDKEKLVKELVNFKKALHRIRGNARNKNLRTLERCEAEKNG